MQAALQCQIHSSNSLSHPIHRSPYWFNALVAWLREQAELRPDSKCVTVALA